MQIKIDFTALAIQTGYAATNGLNLLAAGLSNVPSGTTGSGFHYFNGTSQVLISSVSTSNSLSSLIPGLSVRTFQSFCSQVSN